MQALASHYHIRTATQADIDSIVGFWQQIDKAGEPRPFGGDTIDKPDHAKRIIQHTLDTSTAQLLVCTYKTKAIATIAGHIFDKPAVNLSPVGVIYSLWVEPQYRRQGIAQHLLSRLESSLTNLGAKAMQVGWDSPNENAGRWWKARGYEPYEIIASKKLD